MAHQNLSAAEAVEKLKEGNKRYLEAASNPGDISLQIRKKTCDEGQEPYAVVITCSDSRVIPESIFTAGIGENTPTVRADMCHGLEFLGVRFDDKANLMKNDGTIRVISAKDSKVAVLVIPTNEELVIARETAALV